MFETEDFREQIEAAISREAGRNNMREYQAAIVNRLQRLASENERDLMEEEFRKSVTFRRGVSDALQSVRELTRDASRYALLEGRTVLELSDIQKAYDAKFCQFWPFCR
jgi:histone H3/H4